MDNRPLWYSTDAWRDIDTQTRTDTQVHRQKDTQTDINKDQNT